jgi:hypothetical protein
MLKELLVFHSHLLINVWRFISSFLIFAQNNPNTLKKATNVLKKSGARAITALVIHAFLSKRSIEKLIESSIGTFVFTNTVPISKNIENLTIQNGESKIYSN